DYHCQSYDSSLSGLF
nr:immunoglobulin light chain junction region [Macaca mulatta]MOW57273.1 immunoglobulin light chain junction region [Macaca mulatta]MOW58204.1 immunoglobulin light chain junction region [Macaca mulatta]MOW58841.1 immunoglobulin light chain junction region [Macaca mulatta]MOW59387.1 immunoglobulin light chain junction region [Macaca mulatta]